MRLRRRVRFDEAAPPAYGGAMLTFPLLNRIGFVAAAFVVVAIAGHTINAATDVERVAYKAGDLTIETPWTRATPGGAKVAGGYLRITNGGKEPDRLTGGSLTGSGRAEVHEMKTEAGIMRMRPIDGGLVIAPGQTVELAPGGYHMMFMDLTVGLKQGDKIKGTLTFEKAGTVAVEFAVRAIGASGGAKHGH
jgi:periplasmic copper chaperone A